MTHRDGRGILPDDVSGTGSTVDTGVSLSIEACPQQVLLSEDLLSEVVVCDSSEPEPGLSGTVYDSQSWRKEADQSQADNGIHKLRICQIWTHQKNLYL